LAPGVEAAQAGAALSGDIERYQEVDLDSLEMVRPRTIGVEHAALSAMRRCGFEDKLAALGLNRPQIAAAAGNIVARMATRAASWQPTRGCASARAWVS